MMSQLRRFLWCVKIILMVVIPVGGQYIAEHFPSNTQDNGYYNIKIDSLEKDLHHLQTSVNNINKLLQHVFSERKVDPAMPNGEFKSLVLETKSKNDTSIGFTTKLKQTTYNSSFSIIRGSHILYNGGSAYNGTVFTCPSNGLYLFHVTVFTATKNNGIWIYKNSQRLTLAYSGYDPQYNGASTSAAVWLDVGDQVFLRSDGSSLFVFRESVFTGVKLN